MGILNRFLLFLFPKKPDEPLLEGLAVLMQYLNTLTPDRTPVLCRRHINGRFFYIRESWLIRGFPIIIVL